MFDVLTRWIHIVSASIWLGGMVLIIAMNRLPPRTEENVDALRRLGQASSPVLRASLYIAIFTGIVNALNKGLISSDFLSYPGYLVLAKAGIAVIVIMLAFFHVDLGKAAGTKERMGPMSGARLRFVATGWVSLALTLILVLLGVLLS